MTDFIAREAAHTSGLYQKRELAIVHGKDAVVWDADGRDAIVIDNHSILY